MPDLEEMKRIIANLKNNKSPGENGVKIEMIVNGGEKYRRSRQGIRYSA